MVDEDAQAEVSESRHVSAIWILPLVAIVLAAWMVVYSLRTRGPEVEIVFDTAEGIEAGVTKIKVREVEVGTVEDVMLGDDLQSVVVRARVDKEAGSLLRSDTQFWVVRARLGTEGISGIATLLSGGYIQLSPGQSPQRTHRFIGLEDPPVTPAGTPGLHFELVGDEAGSLGAGDPILHKGFQVGRIESADLDVQTGEMHYGGFIAEPYARLVTTATRFWNASGIAISTSTAGVKVETGSLQSILLGGVSFGLPEGVESGDTVSTGTVFQLYPDFDAVNAKPYNYALEYVVRFEQSVRGLAPGASVEYRGVTVGSVERLLIEELASDIQRSRRSIPVLIRLEPGRINLPDSEFGVATLRQVIDNAVDAGMRASLVTGSFITGSQYVSLNIYPRAPERARADYASWPTIPSVAGGLEGLEHQLTQVLDKVNALPLEDLAGSAAGAIRSLDELLSSDALRELPASVDATLAEVRDALSGISEDSELQAGLRHTLAELDTTLGGLQDLMKTINDQPNSIIFSRDGVSDPIPPAGAR